MTQTINDIMEKFGVGKIRAGRIIQYFEKNPDEVSHISEYSICASADFAFLQRHPMGAQNKRRIGTAIGVDTFGSRIAVTVYFFRIVELDEGIHIMPKEEWERRLPAFQRAFAKQAALIAKLDAETAGWEGLVDVVFSVDERGMGD